jgi:hypothetical protein
MSVPMSRGDSTGRTGILPVQRVHRQDACAPSGDQLSEPYHVCPHVFLFLNPDPCLSAVGIA